MPESQQRLQVEVVAVAATCARRLHTRVSRVTPVAGSVGNQDFLVDTNAGDYVLKAAPADQLVTEAWACDRVRRLGVSAPEVVVLEAVPASLASPFLIMRRLAGCAVPDSSSALVDVGRELRLAHSVGLSGYGALRVTGSDAVGEHGSWSAFLDEVTSGLGELVAGEVIAEDLATRASDTVTRSDTLHYDQPAVLLQGDLKLQHIFADSTGYTGIIDWGDACAGDPRFDLGRMSMAGPTALRAFLCGYGLSATAELDRSLTAYRLVWNLDALLYEYRAGGDWFDAYRVGARTALDDLAGAAS